MNANQPLLRLFDPSGCGESNGTANESTPQNAVDDLLPSGTVAPGDLELVLAAWQNATERLQRTHEVLCSEVRRLTEELEVKNRELARKNRLADLGQMASHVAHEVRNGLSPI